MRMSFRAFLRSPLTWSSRLYCLLLFLFTWFFWATAIFTHQSFHTFSAKLLLLVGLLGPMIIAALLMRNADLASKTEFIGRLIDVKKVPPAGYAWLIGFPIALVLVSILLSLVIGGSASQFSPVASFVFSPLSFFLFIMSTLLIGPIPEEIGWRGFLLHRLLVVYSPSRASIIVGVVRAAWMLPLFFVINYPLQVATTNMWMIPVHLLTIILQSFAFTFVYLRYKQSIWATILLHFGILFSFLFFRVENTTYLVEMIAWATVAWYLRPRLVNIPAANQPG